MLNCWVVGALIVELLDCWAGGVVAGLVAVEQRVAFEVWVGVLVVLQVFGVGQA